MFLPTDCVTGGVTNEHPLWYSQMFYSANLQRMKIVVVTAFVTLKGVKSICLQFIPR